MSGVAPFGVAAALESDRRVAVAVRDFTIVLVLATVGQRLALPITRGDSSVSMVLPVWLFLLWRGMRTGVYTFDQRRLTATLIGLGALLFASLFSVGGNGLRITSIALILPTYAPFALRVADRGAEVFRRVADRYLKLAAVLAVLGLVQFAVQFAGVRNPDPVGSLVPSSLQVHFYNTIYPWYYGSPYIKSNSFVFLEPSFAAQYLGLAVLLHLWRRQRGLVLPVLYVAGMVVTVAGTGYVLLGVGVLAMGLTRYWYRLGRLVPIAVAGVVIGALSPVGSIILRRLHEGGTATTSTGLRWVVPFQDLGGHWLTSGWHSIVGWGPGSSAPWLDIKWHGRNAVNPLAPLKLLFEYGLIGAVPFLAFLVWVSVTRVPCPPVAIALLTAWAWLSGAILESFLIAPLWIFASAVAQEQPVPALLFSVPARPRLSRRPAPRPSRPVPAPVAPRAAVAPVPVTARPT